MLKLNELVEKNNTNTRTKAFTTFDSKRKFLASDIINEYSNEFIELIKQLKNVFSVAINNTDNTYVVITMYYSTIKKYEYIVCNTSNFDCTSFDSIKNAKNYINNLLND